MASRGNLCFLGPNAGLIDRNYTVHLSSIVVLWLSQHLRFVQTPAQIASSSNRMAACMMVYAKCALGILLLLADEFSYDITLIPHPLDETTDQDRLVKWYEALGFIFVGGGNVMERRARRNSGDK